MKWRVHGRKVRLFWSFMKNSTFLERLHKWGGCLFVSWMHFYVELCGSVVLCKKTTFILKKIHYKTLIHTLCKWESMKRCWVIHLNHLNISCKQLMVDRLCVQCYRGANTTATVRLTENTAPRVFTVILKSVYARILFKLLWNSPPVVLVTIILKMFFPALK